MLGNPKTLMLSMATPRIPQSPMKHPQGTCSWQLRAYTRATCIGILKSRDSVAPAQLTRSLDRKAMRGAVGQWDPPHPGSSRLLPPKGLVSAGTSGLHRRWSLGGNSPQPALAKTCDPNVDPWPRWLRLPSSGPRSIPQGAGRCLLPFHLFNRHL